MIFGRAWKQPKVTNPFSSAGGGAGGSRRLGGREAQARVGQVPDLLGELRLQGRRQADPVRQDEIHLREAGGREIAQPGDLDGSRPPREDGQAVVHGVAGQVDQDVNAVVVDEARGGFVGKASQRLPPRHVPAQPSRELVRLRVRRIGHPLDAAGVGMGERRFEEVADRVLAQVAGDQPHAQAFRGGVAGPGRIRLARAGARERAVGLRFLEQDFRRFAGGVIQQEEEARPRFEVIGPEVERAAIARLALPPAGPAS